MRAIFKREWNAYFTSAIGYIVLAGLFFLAGTFFTRYSLVYGVTNMTYQFTGMLQYMMIFVPFLTMRMFSEDKKQKTDQALLTAPISLASLVMGKFFAAFAVYSIGVSITMVQAVILGSMAQLEWGVIFGNYIVILLIGAAFITMGGLVSALTENQFIAAIGSFGIIAVFMFLDMSASSITNPVLAKIVDGISFYGKYEDFTKGIFNIANTIFFLSVSAVFIFLTVRAIEKRRWS